MNGRLRATAAAFIFAGLAAQAVTSARADCPLMTTEWETTHGEWATTCGIGYLALDATGDVYVTGPVGSSHDFLTARFAGDGTLLWVRRYDGPANREDFVCGIAIDQAGNSYVSGESFNERYDFDYATVKYAPDGTELWVRRYSTAADNDDLPAAVAVDSAGDVYVTGMSCGTVTCDYTTVKYAPDGTELWVRRYNRGGNVSNIPAAMALDQTGDVYVTGTSSDGFTDRFVTVKYASDGAEVWVADHDTGAIGGFLAAIVVDEKFNVYLAGSILADLATFKYASDGTLLWLETYDGPMHSQDEPQAIAVDQSGNVYVSGNSQGPVWARKPVIVKYSSDGTEQWVRRFDSPADGDFDAWHAIALDKAGNVFVTGMATFLAPGSGDFITLMYAPDGTELWMDRYGTTGSGHAIHVGDDGYVYAGGRAASSVFLVIKYAPNEPPAAEAGGPYSIECGGLPATVALDAAASFDPDGEPITYAWTSDCRGSIFDHPESPMPTLSLSGPPPCPVECGVTLAVEDGAGCQATDTAPVMVSDTTPPVLPPGEIDRYCLWPPNHWYVCFGQADFGTKARDACGGQVQVLFAGCQSDQPDETGKGGDGNSTEDCLVSADRRSLCARAERQGGDPAGRHYTVTGEILDECGNTTGTMRLGTVYVPHDRNPREECLDPTKVGLKPGHKGKTPETKAHPRAPSARNPR